jgi:hypothetical protein
MVKDTQRRGSARDIENGERFSVIGGHETMDGRGINMPQALHHTSFLQGGVRDGSVGDR